MALRWYAVAVDCWNEPFEGHWWATAGDRLDEVFVPSPCGR